MIELKHDDPDALEHVLHHIYNIPPRKFDASHGATGSTFTWLRTSTWSSRQRNRTQPVHPRRQHSARLRRDLRHDRNHQRRDEARRRLCPACTISALLLNDRVCKKVDEHKDWRWEIINTLVDQKKRSGEYSVFSCPSHIAQLFLSGRERHMGRCSLCRGNEAKTTMKPAIVYFEK